MTVFFLKERKNISLCKKAVQFALGPMGNQETIFSKMEETVVMVAMVVKTLVAAATKVERQWRVV